MLAFDDFALATSDELDLEVGAALVARDAYPEIAIDALLGRLDALALPIAPRDLAGMPTDEAAGIITRYLFDDLGFRGNEDQYGDPRNSYLNDVLDRRLGIPISLALVLLAVTRRVGMVANGISFPGHFLVRIERPRGGPLVVDPFHGGQRLTLDDLGRLLRRAVGPTAKLQLEHLRPASNRAILVRVLQNLKAAHLARGDTRRALVAAARIVTLSPKEAWAVRDRGVLQAQLGAPLGARADLERYLELAPDAPDAQAIRQLLGRLLAHGSSLN